MQAAQDFRVGTEVQAGEVEEGQQVTVPDVEEEVVGPLVVPVLDDLGQRELQDPVVEPDRPLHVGAEQRGVVDPARAARPPVVGDVFGVQPGTLRLDVGEVHRPGPP
jgi:hypothetical protein